MFSHWLQAHYKNANERTFFFTLIFCVFSKSFGECDIFIFSMNQVHSYDRKGVFVLPLTNKTACLAPLLSY